MSAADHAHVTALIKQVHERISRARASAADTWNEVSRLRQQVNLLAAAQLRLISVLLQAGTLPGAEVRECVATLEAVLRMTEDQPVDWSKLDKPDSGKPQTTAERFSWNELPEVRRVDPPPFPG